MNRFDAASDGRRQHRRRLEPRDALAVLFGFLLVVPLFLDVGPGGVSPPRSIFEPRASPYTQTLPIGLFASGLLFAGVLARSVLRGRLRLRGPRRTWVILGSWLAWLFTLAVAVSDQTITPLLFAVQSTLPLLAYFGALHLVDRPRTATRFVTGIVTGLAVTVWLHFAGFVAEVGWSGIVGSRMTTDVWGYNIYQAYNYYPLVLACAFIVVFARQSYLHRSLRGFLGKSLAVYLPTAAMLSLLAVRGPVLIVMLGVLGILAFQWRRSYPRLVAFVGATAITIGLLVSVLAYLATNPDAQMALATLERVQAAVTAQDAAATTTFRVPILKEAADVFLARWYTPFVGTMMRPPAEAFPEVVFNWPSTHNYYFDQLVWSGIPAFLLVVLLMTDVVRRLWRAYCESTDPQMRATALGVLTVWILIVVISNNFRVPLRQPYPGCLIWALAGVVIGGSSGPEREHQRDQARADSSVNRGAA